MSELSRQQRRISALRHLLERWIVDLPAIQAADAERARDHQQAIVDLRHLIASLETEPAAGIIPTAESEGVTLDPALKADRDSVVGLEGTE